MKFFMLCVLILMSFNITGCIPYDKPEFVEIESNETAFLIPLQGETKDQKKFMSEEYLNSSKVALKRIQIPHVWVQLGKWESDGEYKPTMRLIKVNRSPITREWSSSDKGKDETISAESSDSIGVKSGFSITAWITEEDTAKFLYKFQAASLATIMDTNIRQSIQSEYTSICSKYALNELRSKKSEITMAIRDIVIPKFKEMGITIDPSLGIVGGFEYENKAIQDAIDKVFIDQQLEKSNSAKKVAQEEENKRLLSITINEAEMAKAKAIGEANALIEKAKGEAESIKKIATSLQEAGNIYIAVKQIEAFVSAINKWNGTVPATMVNGGSGNLLQHLMLNEEKSNK